MNIEGKFTECNMGTANNVITWSNEVQNIISTVGESLYGIPFVYLN